jgi:succinate dehydrogenase / fumarate reductase iron-sulfur subunit/fumarate reductase iron-sulfur subunit
VPPNVIPRQRTLRLVVARSDPSARREFSVAATDPVTVLDLLLAVQRTQDPSVGFRYSCRVAMCGTCGVRVNGRSALACRSRIQPDEDEVVVAPLAGLPVARDLIVDMKPFWREWASVMPWFVPDADAEHERIPTGSRESSLVDGALGCISCGACYSSCEIARHGGDFLGPAALNRALALVADPRDAARRERLRLVAGRRGVDGCHYVGACASACPVGLDPSASIRELRRIRLKAS